MYIHFFRDEWRAIASYVLVQDAWLIRLLGKGRGIAYVHAPSRRNNHQSRPGQADVVRNAECEMRNENAPSPGRVVLRLTTGGSLPVG